MRTAGLAMTGGSSMAEKHHDFSLYANRTVRGDLWKRWLREHRSH